MKFDLHVLSTPFGQLAVVALLAAITISVVAWQDPQPAVDNPTEAKAVRPSLPKIFQRSVARFEPAIQRKSEIKPSVVSFKDQSPVESPTATELPLTVFNSTEPESEELTPIPLGRLIPCETVFTLESNRLATPVVGLVTEETWYAGEKIVPIGAEIHGRASLDYARDRLAARGPWTLVWSDSSSGANHELQVDGIALSRSGSDPLEDGTAGLPGVIVRTQEKRETKLFAASFLATATAALQDTRTSFSGLGESIVPAATARNATLAGTGAVLREYAQQIREAIAEDGVYVRVPAGTPFYLYVTETIDRSTSEESNHSSL